MLSLLNERHIDKYTRARMYLEIVGNSLLTDSTAAWLRKCSGKLAQAFGQQQRSIGPFDLSLLKDKEKDQMETIFKQWRAGNEEGNKMGEFWTRRQQKWLGLKIP